MSLAYRAGDLVELYSIQLLLKTPRIEVHNKKEKLYIHLVFLVEMIC
jgi:hypothetical protein